MEANTVKSIRELARIVERAHSTVADWTHRADWPFPTRPPWPLALVPAIAQWAEELSEGRYDRPAPVMANSPGYALGWRDMADEHCPFRASKLLGDELFSEQTISDLSCLAVVVSFAIAETLKATATKLGESFRERASQEYFGRLWGAMTADGELLEKLGDFVNRGAMYWLSRRYHGQAGWSQRLPDPPEQSIETYFASEPPLPHRAVADSD